MSFRVSVTPDILDSVAQVAFTLTSMDGGPAGHHGSMLKFTLGTDVKGAVPSSRMPNVIPSS